MARRLPPGDPAEDKADRQSESRQIASPEDVSGHDLSRGEDVFRRAVVLHHDLPPFVHRHSQISEGDARPQRVAVERRRIDRQRPVALRRIEPFGPAVVEPAHIEYARPHRPVELLHGRYQGVRLQFQTARQLGDGWRLDRRVDRGYEAPDRLGVDDAVGDLIRLSRDEPAPDRVARGPEVFPLVVEAPALAVDRDAEGNAVEPGDDTAVEFWSAAVDGDGMAAARIAYRLGAVLQQLLQHLALVVLRAADEEVLRGLPPVFLEPRDIGLE